MYPVNTMEVTCSLDGPHTEHTGMVRDYAYPGSETLVSWEEDDRRTFRGEWRRCPRGYVHPARRPLGSSRRMSRSLVDMPATSKAQYRFMQAVAHGGIRKPGLSKDQAEEYVHGQRYQSLPARTKKAPTRHRSRRAG